MKTKLVPYLTLDGTAREAMTFYQEVLGGELILQTFGDSFPETPEEHRERIMHAQLESDLILMMASDTDPVHSQPYQAGNNVNLSLIGDDIDIMSAQFAKLAEGGSIEMPLAKQFWGDTFGACTDKFGMHWMVNISSGDNESDSNTV